MTIVVGSRVRYERGPSHERWGGLIGKVQSLTVLGNLNVTWENPTARSGKHGSCIAPENVTEITMIDPKRPVQGSNGVLFRTIGVLERVEGTVTLLLQAPTGNEFEIGLDGTIIKPGTGLWSQGYTFSNVPVYSSGFYPLRAGRQGFYGRGMSALGGAKSDYPEAEAYVEILYTDSKATGAKFHAR